MNKYYLIIYLFSGFVSGNELIQNMLNVNTLTNNTFSGHPFLEAISSFYFEHHKIERVKELCSENGGKGAYEELEKNSELFHKCLQSIPIPAEVELPSEICGKKVMKLKNCFDEFKDKINICEKKEEKFLTDFLSESIISMLNYGCEQLQNLFQGITKTMDGLDCIAYFVQERSKSVREDIFSCMKEAQHKEIPASHFSKERYCKRVTDSKDCILELVKNSCKDNRIVKDFVVGLAGQAKAPCKREH